MNPFIRSTASKYGIIIASIAIAYTLIGYLVDLNLLVNMWSGILLWTMNLVLLVVSVNVVKRASEGFLTFREGFSTFVLTYIISALISTVFGILLFSVIDPDAAEELQEMIIETTVNAMERFGTPEATIEEQVEKLENNNQFSIGNQVSGFFWGIVIYSVIGLIVAAIMKKNRPEFVSEIEDSEE